MFSAHDYNGRGGSYAETAGGKAAVTIAASHAVNYFDGEERKADVFSGGLVRMLAGETGCRALCMKRSCGPDEQEAAVKELSDLVKDSRLLIDLQIVENIGESVIQLSPYTDQDKYSFAARVLGYSFEYGYRDSGLDHTIYFAEPESESIISRTAEENGIFYLYLGINKKYCDIADEDSFLHLYHVLCRTAVMLSRLDWSAETIQVYRLWQSAGHKPQDKIEISGLDAGRGPFSESSLLNIYSYGSEPEKVRLHKPGERTLEDLKYTLGESSEINTDEYVFLTNRLIEILFGREWIEGKEEEAGLRGAPVIVYESRREVYPIGLPKASQIDGISFSSGLFDEKKDEAGQFDYVIFNRYTDSRLHIEFDKADYGDFGRVKNADGTKAKKVMIPRYHKRLLGYLDLPLNMIRSEEYKELKERLSHAEKEAFDACYERISGEIFYRLRKQYGDNGRGEDAESGGAGSDIRKTREIVIEAQKRLNLYKNVEVLRIPKEVRAKEKFYKRTVRRLEKWKTDLLEKAIGRSEYLLKTEWTSETDDRNNIARLSPNMMSLLGVSENDKIVIRFGRRQETLRVLMKEELSDYQIGIPAPARKKLGMNSVNDIVIVYRDMMHIFWRHSEEQTIAILGTVLAVFQVISKIWIGVLLCLIITPLIMYFVLNEERVKVK